jgi:hypothetical protein
MKLADSSGEDGIVPFKSCGNVAVRNILSSLKLSPIWQESDIKSKEVRILLI